MMIPVSRDLDTVCPACGSTKDYQPASGLRSLESAGEPHGKGWACPPGALQAEFEQLAMAYFHRHMQRAGYSIMQDVDGPMHTIDQLERSLSREAAEAACRCATWMYYMVAGR